MYSSTMQKSGSRSGVQLVAASMAVWSARERWYCDMLPHWYCDLRQVGAGQASGALAGAKAGPLTGGRAVEGVDGTGYGDAGTMSASWTGGVPERGLAEGETEGLVSGDAGTGVEDAGGDAPGPEAAANVGVGSGRPAGWVGVSD